MYIPEDVRKKPQYITIDSKELESIINKESKKEGIIEYFTSGDSDPKEKHIKIETPKCEWVSAETLLKVITQLTKG